MIQNGFDQITLRELLCNLFFDENKLPFLIIYDINNILSDFLEQEISNPGKFNILSIQATQNPIEFLDRLKIVEDFNENMGWYNHSWIIHVFGEYSREIESFGSFHYYKIIGRDIIIEDFYDLLMIPELNLVRSKNLNSLLEQEPSINQFLLKYLVEIPIACYISTDRTLNESATWMTLFTSNSIINPSQKAESPLWISFSQEKSLFSNEKVLLELIFNNDLIVPKTLDNETINYMNKFFNKLLTELEVTNFTFTEDWYENLTQLIQFIFHYGKLAYLKKVKGKNKEVTIDSFLNLENNELKIPRKTIERFGNFLNEWLNHGDKTLLLRFQQRTKQIRKKQSSIMIKQEEIDKFEENFSFTGIIDIQLALNLLESQQKNPLKKEEWIYRISPIMNKREKLWKNYARLWWKDRNLFASDKDLISVNNLWEFVLKAGILLSYEIKSSEWQTLQKIAWEIEETFTFLSKPKFINIFKSEDSFKSLIQILEILNPKYIECQKKINSQFSNFFINILDSEEINDLFNFNNALWDESINYVKNNGHIGFIFCDALRQDLANELKQKIEAKWNQNKASLMGDEVVKEIQSLTSLPSITNIGWNQILRKEDYIYIKISGDNLSSGIENKSEKKIYYNFSDRNSRILQILDESGKKIEILDIDPKSFKEQRNIISQKINQNNSVKIPILWYDKFDNHDFSFEEFLEKKDFYLDELGEIIWNLHEIGIENIYILSDHGFIFAKNENILEEKPNGVLHKRYCLSPNTFTEEEYKQYPNWNFFTPEQFGYKFEEDSNKCRSIIVPLGYSIFKKSKKDTDFYLHGGLSYQECDLLHLKSQCVLKPEVKIEKIEIKDHEKIEGQDVYCLKEMGDSKYLEFVLATQKKGTSSMQLRPISIKVVCQDSRIHIDPNQELTLTSGYKKKFKLSFKKEYTINSIEVEIKNSENEIIHRKKFSVIEPSIYGSESLF